MRSPLSMMSGPFPQKVTHASKNSGSGSPCRRDRHGGLSSGARTDGVVGIRRRPLAGRLWSVPKTRPHLPSLSLEVVVASDPMGLIGGAVEVGGEASASTTIERFSKRTAKAIAERLRVQFQKRGWVHSSGTESAVPFNTRAQRERRTVVLEDPVQRLRPQLRLPDGAARVSVTDDFNETPSGLKRTAAREALLSPLAAPATFSSSGHFPAKPFAHAREIALSRCRQAGRGCSRAPYRPGHSRRAGQVEGLIDSCHPD
jgi:hypothetical protein